MPLHESTATILVTMYESSALRLHSVAPLAP
jgi:hypothetical protein